MSFQLNVPPSVIARLEKEAEQDGGAEGETDTQAGAKRREDWRKLKELEEARKAGTAPAMQDEEGRDINPHIPQYIMQAPWYFGATAPTLNHQRPPEESEKIYSSGWYKKGVKEGPVSTKYRKGACENCGAVTHKRKDCLERPRKIGARFTGRDFAPDEYNQPELDLSYDGKRDRWNGYDPIEHKRIIEEYQQIDDAKRLLKAQRIEELVQQGDIAPEEAKKVMEGDEDEEDEDKYAEDVDMPGHKFESKQRITVRNLRIREDTAKYLYNLDVNSAHYDPKTRAMRDNPFKTTGKEAKELPYAGDNFVRWSGDAMEMARQQLFAWEAYEKGSEVNLQADPTKLDTLTKEYSKKKDEYKTSTKESILERYGGQEHLDAPPKQMLMAQTEDYVEYSRQGTILKGQEKAQAKSSYEEDIFPKNHTSVWGSFWKDGHWGFVCCHSFVRDSYCTGEAGKDAEETSILTQKNNQTSPIQHQTNVPAIEGTPSEHQHPSHSHSADGNASPTDSETESSSSSSSEEERRRRKKEKKRAKKRKMKQKEKDKKRKKKKKRSSDSSDSDSESEDEEAKRERRILQAILKEEARLVEVDRMLEVDERKRGYNVTYEVKAPTEDDIEAYHRKRVREDDPMAQFMK